MTKEEYDNKKEKNRSEYDATCRSLRREYAFSNNHYKVGDIFKDHIGRIKITEIRVYHGSTYEYPSCYYIGIVLKKDGTATKNNVVRDAYQINEKQ